MYRQECSATKVHQKSKCIGELNQKHELNEQHTSNTIKNTEGMLLI